MDFFERASERAVLTHLADNQLPERRNRPALHWKKRKCLTFMEDERRQENIANEQTHGRSETPIAPSLPPTSLTEQAGTRDVCRNDENSAPTPVCRFSMRSTLLSPTSDAGPTTSHEDFKFPCNTANPIKQASPRYAVDAHLAFLSPQDSRSTHNEKDRISVGYRGCVRDGRTGEWLALSRHVTTHAVAAKDIPASSIVGRFSTATDAAQAYDIEALRREGVEAVVNFASSVISSMEGSAKSGRAFAGAVLGISTPQSVTVTPISNEHSPASLSPATPRAMGAVSWNCAKGAWAVFGLSCSAGNARTLAYFTSKAAAVELSNHLKSLASSVHVRNEISVHDTRIKAADSPQDADARVIDRLTSTTSPSAAEQRRLSAMSYSTQMPATPSPLVTKPTKKAPGPDHRRRLSNESTATAPCKVGAAASAVATRSPQRLANAAVAVVKRAQRSTGPRRTRFPVGFLARSTSHGIFSRHHGVVWSAKHQSWTACVWMGRFAKVVGICADESSAAAMAVKEAKGVSTSQAAPLPYSGISWHKATSRWTACHIQLESNQPLWLGVFDSATSGIAALNAAAHRRPPSSTKKMSDRCCGDESASATDVNDRVKVVTERAVKKCSAPKQEREPSPQKATKQQQQPHRTPSSFRGVSVSDAYGKWRAQVWDGAKVLYIGSFDSEEAAARAYDLALLRLRGSDKALRTNFPIADYIETLTNFAAESPELTSSGSPLLSTSNPCKESDGGGATPVVVLADRRKIRQSATCLVDANAAANPVGATQRVAQASKGSSTYKGVSWSERSSKWRAQIWHGGRVHHLGFFEVETDAAEAFDVKAREFRGARAVTNFASANVSTAVLPTPKRRRVTSSKPTKSNPVVDPSPTPPVKAAADHILEPASPAPREGEADDGDTRRLSTASSLMSRCPHANILGALNALSPTMAPARAAC